MEQLWSPQGEHEDIHCALDQDNMDEKESLDCPVCLEPYNEGLHLPKMMPCLHTLCASCIANLTSSVAKQKPDLTETVTSPSPESRFRLAFLRFASQPNLISTSISERSGQEAANHTSTGSTASDTHNNSINVTQNNRQHPVLRRVAGQGPTSPITRQPQDPLSPPPLTSPTPSVRPPISHKPKGGVSGSLKRPEISPPLPPKPAEPQIPKDVVVQCPLCRSEVSTSKLQTNRYVLAHMRDLARLSFHSSSNPFRAEKPASTTQPTCPREPPEELWCEECKQPATDSCAHHEVMPIAEWVETQKAILESLRMEVEDQLGQHNVYLQGLEKMMKDVYHSLNKASRFVWQANIKVEDFKDELKRQPPIPATDSTQNMAETLKGKVTQMERLVKRVSKENLLAGNDEVMVSFKQPQQQILIRTSNPTLAIIVTIAECHANV